MSLTNGEFLTLKRDHVPDADEDGPSCWECADEWPCQTARLIEEIERLRSEVGLLKFTVDQYLTRP